MSESSKVQIAADIKEGQTSLLSQFSLAMLLHWMLMLLLLGSSQGKRISIKDHFKLQAPSFLSALDPDVEDKKGSFGTLMEKHGSMLKDRYPAPEESLEDEIEEMIQSVQTENMKPIQGSWYWNPINMTFIWSIQRPIGIGGSDRYTLAFNQEGIEFGKAEGFENPGELEESKLENFVFGTETEEVLGSQTGTN